MTKIENITKKIKEAAAKIDCWTCECLQGFITQLLTDQKNLDTSELKKLLRDKSVLHFCLECVPCPPGELFAKYLKCKNDISIS